MSKVGPSANGRGETQSDSHPSAAWRQSCGPASPCLFPLHQQQFGRGSGDDDECNVLIRSILFEDVDSVEVYKADEGLTRVFLQSVGADQVSTQGDGRLALRADTFVLMRTRR